MTTESKIVFRSDASEPRRDLPVLIEIKKTLLAIGKAGAGSSRIAAIEAKRAAQIDVIGAKARLAAQQTAHRAQLAHQKNVASIVLNRQRDEIASNRESSRERLKLLDTDRKRERLAVGRAKAARDEVVAARTQKAIQGQAGGRGGPSALGIGIAGVAADLGAQAARAAGRMAIDAAMAAVSAQGFREDAIAGLGMITKSAAAGEKAFQMALKTADFLGKGEAVVTGDFLDFLAKGFKVEKVDELVRRLADLATVDPRANLEGIQRAIGQIAGKGRLQGDELLQLAENGLETSAVYQALAKSLGKSIPEIMKLQAAGKIQSDVAVDAILAAIAEQTGGKAAGVAARERSLKNINGLIERIKAIPQNLLFDIVAGDQLGQIKGVMREIVDFFDASSSTGKDAREAVSGLFKALVEGLIGADLSKTGNVTEVLKSLVEGAKGAGPQIKEFATGIRQIGSAIVWIVSIAGKLSAAKGAVSGFVDEMGPLGKAFSVLGKFMTGRGIFAALDIAGWIGDLGSGIADAWRGLFASLRSDGDWFSLGSSWITGLINGIKSGVAGVWAAAKSTAQSALDAVAGLWVVKSPSKRAEYLGDMFGTGQAQGIENTRDQVRMAANDNAKAALQGAAPMAAGPAPAAQPIRQGHTVTYAPVYNTQMTAEELEEAQARDYERFNRLFDRRLREDAA